MTSVRQIAQKGVLAKKPAVSGQDAAKIRPGFLSRIAHAWRTVLDSLVPAGYEDETGFHFGDRTGAN
jgi:hypothetical protein